MKNIFKEFYFLDSERQMTKKNHSKYFFLRPKKTLNCFESLHRGEIFFKKAFSSDKMIKKRKSLKISKKYNFLCFGRNIEKRILYRN